MTYIKGMDSLIHTYGIDLEDDAKPTRQMHRGLNLAIKEVY